MKPFIFLLLVLIGSRPELYGQIGNAEADSTAYHWLALGDSYTIGESVGLEDRFPALTAVLLQKRLQKSIRMDYIAATGWTTKDLQNALSHQQVGNKYDWVTLLIGVNDQYQGLDTGGYRKRFTKLLETALTAVRKRKERVFVVSIPDYSVTPFGKGSETIHRGIRDFNRINLGIANQYQVNYCNITCISEVAGTDPTLTAKDGLHPSAKQYSRWSAKLADAVITAIQ